MCSLFFFLFVKEKMTVTSKQCVKHLLTGQNTQQKQSMSKLTKMPDKISVRNLKKNTLMRIPCRSKKIILANNQHLEQCSPKSQNIITFLLLRNSRAVLQFERKWGLLKTLPFSIGSFIPDRTSSKAKSRVPSLRSSIRLSIFSGGLRCKIKKKHLLCEGSKVSQMV